MSAVDPMQAIIGMDIDSPEVECPVSDWPCWRQSVTGSTLTEIRDMVAAHLTEVHPTVIDAELVLEQPTIGA